MILSKRTKNRDCLLRELGAETRIEGNNTSENDSFLVVQENGEIYLKNELDFPLIKDKDLIVGNKYMCCVNKYKYNPVKEYIYAGFLLSLTLDMKTIIENGQTNKVVKVILRNENIFKNVFPPLVNYTYTRSVSKVYAVSGENYPLDDFEEYKEANRTSLLTDRINRFDNSELFIEEINHMVRNFFNNNIVNMNYNIFCYNLKNTKALKNLIESNIQLIRNNII